MPAIKPPCQLDPASANLDDFELWMEAFTDYIKVTQEGADNEMKISLFLSIGGMELRRVVKGLQVDDKKFDSMVTAVRKYFRPVKNVVLERHKFYSIVRREEESLGDFLVRLKSQASSCDFGDSQVDTVFNQMVRDQFIRGVNDTKIAESLLATGMITLKEAIEKADCVKQAVEDSKEKSHSNASLALHI